MNYFKICTTVLLASVYSLVQGAAGRDVTLLDRGWKFTHSDDPAAISLSFDDSGWESVDVPHDWAIKGPFDMEIDAQRVMVLEDGEQKPALRTGRTGSLPWIGVGVYRKLIELPKSAAGKSIYLEFDGAMSNAKVYFNGEYIGEHPYGYTSFGFDVSRHAVAGGKNLLYVHLENKGESSRWYPGGGIYRNVRLVVTDQLHVARWGTFIRTENVSASEATVNITTDISNMSGEGNLKLVTEIVNSSGKVVAKEEKTFDFSGEGKVEQSIKLSSPSLWSIESPALYSAVSKLYSGNKLKDVYTTRFGIRSLAFDKDKGFFLNGKHIKLYGVCNHHDLGPLGAAVNYRATERQVEMLKEMGANAIRTSHNPASPELIEICDRMGMLVIEESFDEWKSGKNRNGYSTIYDKWAEEDINSMIRRDRNSPSIIMWSIGNEIREQRQPDGAKYGAFLAGICRREDPTRPVTAGFDQHRGALSNGLAATIDVVGFNYKPQDYVWAKQNYPSMVFYGSETASTVSSRGNYVLPLIDGEKKGLQHPNFQSSSYDTESTSWATLPDTEFAAQDDNEFVLGEFVWTGFDYLGEPTPYNDDAPSRSSYFGIIDLAGLPKDRFYLYQSQWSSSPVLHLLPHWNWEGREGQTVPVMCYTNYAKAELFVNGVSQGVLEKSRTGGKLNRYRLVWDKVVYAPGEIKVVAYDANGAKAAETSVKTAGKPASIVLEADRSAMKADGKDLSYITVKVVDKDGNPCPLADDEIAFTVSGAGLLEAVCNGDAASQVSFASDRMPLFNGMMVATVKSSGKGGAITLTASASGLTSATINIRAK